MALQYWLFYAFNDFNNLHEGDWEMIQLVFDARDAREAIAEEPQSIGYSSHEGAERAEWGDEKLEVVEGTHPVVYPAAGSHANKFTEALYLGSSAEAGVGCDDTRGPHVEFAPAVETIPSDPDAARRAFPWIVFEGRWGELQRAFFNGPTGPNLKSQWNEPIGWSEDWRPRSYAIPTGGLLGTGATDFFCTAVETGSKGLVALLRDPALTLLTLAALLAVAAWAITRTTWKPVAPLRLARRRSWGQILAAAGRMYVQRTRLFLGIGLLLIPLGFVISLVEALVLGGFGLLGVETTGESAGALVLLVATVGTTLALLGLAFVQAATTCALVKLDEGRDVGPVHAYRLALPRFRPLAGGLALAVAVSLVLTATAILIPVAIWLGVRWALLAQTVELEGRGALGGLRRSAELVRGRWLRVASLVGVGAALVLVAGPLLGALLILLTRHAAPVAQRRCGRRLRSRDALRRPRDGVRLLRREGARRARDGAGARGPPCGDRVFDLSAACLRGELIECRPHLRELVVGACLVETAEERAEATATPTTLRRVADDLAAAERHQDWLVHESGVCGPAGDSVEAASFKP